MPKINLSGMTVEALMDLRKRVDEALHKRGAELQQQLAALGVTRVCARRWKLIKGKESPAEISWSIRRNLGRSWRKSSLA